VGALFARSAMISRNSRCAVISQRVAPWYTALISTGVCIQVCTVDSAENIDTEDHRCNNVYFVSLFKNKKTRFLLSFCYFLMFY